MSIFRSKRLGLLLGAALVIALAGCTAGSEPAPVPHATSSLDASQRRMACLQDKGWEVHLGDDGSVQGTIPIQQMDAFQRDNEECGYGLIPDRSIFTPKQWAAAYAIAIETADCLDARGYHVDDRPTLQAYIDMGGDWNPYIRLLDDGTIKPAEIALLEKSCPQPDYWG